MQGDTVQLSVTFFKLYFEVKKKEEVFEELLIFSLNSQREVWICMVGDQLFQEKRLSAQKALPALRGHAGFDRSCKLITAQGWSILMARGFLGKVRTDFSKHCCTPGFK